MKGVVVTGSGFRSPLTGSTQALLSPEAPCMYAMKRPSCDQSVG